MLDCSTIVERCESSPGACDAGRPPPGRDTSAEARTTAAHRYGSTPAARRRERKLRRDLHVLVAFVRVFCDGKHKAIRAGETPAAADKTAHVLGRVFDEVGYGGPLPDLCGECARLLAHALVMRVRCPLDPKPMCKHCPQHCYAPRYRTQIRAVMRYAGPRLVLRGRLDYLWHLLR